MSETPMDSPTCADGVDNTQSSTWIDTFYRLNYYLSGSALVLCYRFIDIVLLSLGLYYGIGTCRISSPLAKVSISLLVFDGIDLAIVLLFLRGTCKSGNITLPDGGRLRPSRRALFMRTFFLFFKFITSCVGTGYAFQPAASSNPDCEVLRYCLGIVCYSTLIKIFMPTGSPALPIRQSPITAYFTILISVVFSGVYVGVILSAANKTTDSACMYTNIQDFYFRAPLKLFAYIGVILASWKVVLNVLHIFINRLFFRLPTWRTAILRLLGVSYALGYLILLATVYYFSVGAVLLFQPRSGGSCRSVAPSLYTSLLVCQWIYTLSPITVLPVVFLLICLGVCCGDLLASCLPASMAVPLLEALREWAPEAMQNAPAPAAPNAPASPGTIDALPMVAFGKESNPFNQTECAICRSDFEPNEQLKRLPCGHVFHASCVANWLIITRICPVCRHRLAARN